MTRIEQLGKIKGKTILKTKCITDTMMFVFSDKTYFVLGAGVSETDRDEAEIIKDVWHFDPVGFLSMSEGVELGFWTEEEYKLEELDCKKKNEEFIKQCDMERYEYYKKKVGL